MLTERERLFLRQFIGVYDPERGIFEAVCQILTDEEMADADSLVDMIAAISAYFYMGYDKK